MSQLSRHVEVIYCDDIRQEVGAKLSFMGIYTGDMILGSIPAILPKLCIAINFVTPIDDPFESLRIHIFQDGIENPIISTDTITAPPRVDDNDGANLLMAHLMLTMSPFQIESPTALRVVADTERGQLKGRGLRIIGQQVGEPTGTQ